MDIRFPSSHGSASLGLMPNMILMIRCTRASSFFYGVLGTNSIPTTRRMSLAKHTLSSGPIEFCGACVSI